MHGSNTDRATGAGRHRRPRAYRGRHQPAEVASTARRWAAPRLAATLLLVSIAVGSVSITIGGDTGPRVWSSAAEATALQVPVERQREQTSRSMDRATPQSAASSPPSTGSAAPAASPSPGLSDTPSTLPQAATSTQQPVGGLTKAQMNYAAIIVRVGRQLQLPQRAYIVAIATALQESRLLNLANWAVPQSLNLTHDGVGGDHDSVGLFQQRPSSGWGTVAELMDPATSARKFYRVLAQVAGWQNMSVAAAAQAVQVSAFPDAYAQQEAIAALVVNAL
jgi:hypothetical protein